MKKDLLTQKILGVIVILLGALTGVILDGDVTFTIFAILLGLWMLLSKKSLLSDD